MINIEEVSPEKYQEIFYNPYHIFAGASFNQLNRSKAEEIYFLLLRDSKYRCGIVGGIKNNSFYSPFSAPFGGFIPLDDELRLSILEESLDSFIHFLKKKKIEAVHFTLPPSFYNESFISKCANVLYRKGFSIDNIELNYQFDLKNFNSEYHYFIKKNARKNLKNSLGNNLSFQICEDSGQQKEAYETIKKNRQERGFPLRMTWEQVEATINVIPADFFLVYEPDGNKIAAAMVFHVANKIVQVIYWGDIPEFAHLRTMNYLSYKVFEFYKEKDIRFIDIGPSTENSLPNHGLCEFKESIGCDISTKIVYSKKLI